MKKMNEENNGSELQRREIQDRKPEQEQSGQQMERAELKRLLHKEDGTDNPLQQEDGGSAQPAKRMHFGRNDVGGYKGY